MGCAEAVKALSNLNCVSMMWLGMNGVCRCCESAFKLKLCDHDVLGYESALYRGCESAFKLKLCDHDVLGYESALYRGCESAFKVKLTEQDVVWYEWGVQRL